MTPTNTKIGQILQMALNSPSGVSLLEKFERLQITLKGVGM